MNTTKPKHHHGFYSDSFTPEELASLDAMPTHQFVKRVRMVLLVQSLDLLKDPTLTPRQVLQVLNTITRLISK